MSNKSTGTSHFIIQRLTAFTNMLIGIPAFIIFLSNYDSNYSTVKDLMSKEYIWIPMIIYILSLSYHMMIGMGHVLDDYIDNVKLKSFLITMNKLYVYLIALFSSITLIILGLF